jgi:hypothetical protein
MEIKDLVEYIRRVKADSVATARSLTDPEDHGSKRFHNGYAAACDTILETMNEWGIE